MRSRTVTATTFAETCLEFLDASFSQISYALNLPSRLQGPAFDRFAIPGTVHVSVFAPRSLNSEELSGALGTNAIGYFLEEGVESALGGSSFSGGAHAH